MTGSDFTDQERNIIADELVNILQIKDFENVAFRCFLSALYKLVLAQDEDLTFADLEAINKILGIVSLRYKTPQTRLTVRGILVKIKDD